jgi:hypothetical protein
MGRNRSPEQKSAKRKHDPEQEKKARGTDRSQSSDGMNLCWHLGMIEWDGPFGWDGLGREKLKDIVKKAKHFESMTWAEIKAGTHGERGKSNNHFVPVADCVKEAQKRFKQLVPYKKGIDEVFCLRLQGKERIIGIVEGHIFKVFWWDPDHSVCESGEWR